MAKAKEKNNNRFSYRNGLNEIFATDLQNPLADNLQVKKNNETIKEILNEMNSNPDSIKDVDVEQENQENLSDGLKLIPGETLIGTKYGNIKGELRELHIYYGNFVRPMVQNQFVFLKKKEYLKMLDDFLTSEAGSRYDRPSQEEMDKAFEEVKAVEKAYLEKQKQNAQADLLQPGRNLPSGEYKIEKEEIPPETKEGQSSNDKQETQFIDDIPSEEAKAVEFIKNKNYTRQQIKEIRKSLESEKRGTTIGSISIIVVALSILAVAIFLIKDIVIASRKNIELELTLQEVEIKAGDIFNPLEYVKYVTEDDDVYIIYPSLDTSEIGTYNLDFVATNNYSTNKKTLKVNVIDGKAPEIILNEEEILLVRDRDEGNFDPLNYVEEIFDNIDIDLKCEASILDWEKDEQEITYTVKDSSNNQAQATLKVKIEDKAICDKNASYDEKSNTCSCNSGYTGDGSSCRIIQSRPTSSSTSSSQGSSSSQSPSSSSGSSSSSSSGSSSGSSQPSNPTPSYSPYITASSVSVKVGTSIGDVQARIVSSISSSSSYTVDFSNVNTSAPGSYIVYITGADGASTTCTVTVTE